MHAQFFLYLHFYLLHLLWNSCDGNDRFWRHSMLVKQSSSFNRKHQTLYLHICVHQTVRLTTEFVDWWRNVCTLHKHLSAIPAAVRDLKQRLINTWASIISQNLIDEAVVNGKSACVRAWGKRTSVWISAKLKPSLFRTNTTQPALFRATNSFNSLPRKTRCFASFLSQLFKSK